MSEYLLVSKRKKMNNIYKILIIFIFLYSSPLFSTTIDKEKQITINNLELVLESISNVSTQITRLQETLQSSKGIGREQEIRMQIKELSEKLKYLNNNFSQLSTGVDTEIFVTKEKKSINWSLELKELLEPLINELKKMTSHPRELDKLRNDIEKYESELQLIEKAIDNINILLTSISNKKLIDKLETNKSKWENKKNEIKTRINITKQQYQHKLFKKKKFSQTVQEFFQIFFKSRGKNLIISFLSFILTWFILHNIHKLIRKISPFHTKIDRSIYVRTFDMIFVIFTVLCSFLTLLAILYLFGDWFLLSIAIIFLLGIGWASNQAVPKYWQQAKLILNFGPVREGELVVYNGLPYKVKTINFFTELVNEKLEGGRLLLPLKDLLDLRSRTISKNEPWFPTNVNDWVLLNDNNYGMVTVQTPEIVTIMLLGNTLLTYKTSEFLKLAPQNFSYGFRIWASFAVDYAHQKIVNSVITKELKKQILDDLSESGYKISLKKIIVEFKEICSTSLNIAVITEFDSSVCADYFILQRKIQKICIDTCNLNNWIIPFQQVKVHLPEIGSA